MVVDNNISSGTITATSLIGYGTIPLGGIIMWSGTKPPDGWVLCDGQVSNGYTTPDLRGRFIVGQYVKRSDEQVIDTDMNADYGLVGQQGGAKHITLETSHLPDFTMSIPGQWGRDDQNFTNTDAFTAGDRFPNDITLAFNLEVKYSRNKSSGQYGQPHENRPPYYTLAFIMRVK
jgi:microcystin-dependent protein